MPKAIYMVLCVYVLGGCIPAWADAIDDELREAEQEINRTVPRMVDRSTRLDNAFVYKKTLTYSYTQIAVKSSPLDESKRRKFEKLMKEQVVGKCCSDPGTKAMLDKGISILFVHYSNDYKIISQNKVTKQDCH